MQIICKILFQYRLSSQWSVFLPLPIYWVQSTPRYLYTGYRVLHDTYILGTGNSTIPLYWVQCTPRYLYTEYRVLHDTYILGTVYSRYQYTGYRVLQDTYIMGTGYSTIPIYWVHGTPRYL